MPATEEQTEERPIIFSGWSIRRILTGEKSQTRRILKPQPDHVLHEGKTAVVESPIEVVEDGHSVEKTHADNGSVFVDEIECPYGRPGSVLWVREAFRLPAGMDHLSPSEYLAETSDAVGAGAPICRYEADGAFFREPELEMAYERDAWGRKRPSIFMPRELCRLRLRVEDVRVERLHEISEDDAMAEGVVPVRRQSTSVHGGTITSASVAFKDLWKEIHGDGAWEENPHVWAVEFSKIDTE